MWMVYGLRRVRRGLSDKEVDTLCASPAEVTTVASRGRRRAKLRGRGGGVTLHLPSGGLFSWESNLGGGEQSQSDAARGADAEGREKGPM